MNCYVNVDCPFDARLMMKVKQLSQHTLSVCVYDVEGRYVKIHLGGTQEISSELYICTLTTSSFLAVQWFCRMLNIDIRDTRGVMPIQRKGACSPSDF